MARKFKLQIVTPSGPTPLRMISFLDVPAVEGRLTVLANHEPMICSLNDGLVRIREGDEIEEERWEISRGTMEVTREDVTLLVREIRPESTASRPASR